jgi:formylglycine-generating enzyme required for sulfatase activity
MGTASGDSSPVHAVTLDDFYLDQFEVTNARYQACVSAGGCSAPQGNNSFTRSGYFTNSAFAQYPVVNVTWNQANAFCAAEGKRLPTEAEWEYAAGNGRSQLYPWGDTFDAARTTVTQGDTVQAGSFSNGASELGVFDLAGNALEWVSDWYSSDYYGESPETNPPGPANGAEKVLRGGSFGNPDPTAYLATRRFRRAPGASDVDIGFRCAETVP